LKDFHSNTQFGGIVFYFYRDVHQIVVVGPRGTCGQIVLYLKLGIAFMITLMCLFSVETSAEELLHQKEFANCILTIEESHNTRNQII